MNWDIIILIVIIIIIIITIKIIMIIILMMIIEMIIKMIIMIIQIIMLLLLLLPLSSTTTCIHGSLRPSQLEILLSNMLKRVATYFFELELQLTKNDFFKSCVPEERTHEAPRWDLYLSTR